MTPDRTTDIGDQLRAAAAWADRVPAHHRVQVRAVVTHLTLLLAEMVGDEPPSVLRDGSASS